VTHQEKRVTVVHGKPRFYEPPELKAARQKLTDWLAKYAPEEPMTGAVKLIVVWGFPASKRHPDGTPKTSRPDTDNLQKLLKDCMTAAKWWKDDALVWKETVAKMYFDQPGITIVAECDDGAEGDDEP
jgi:Holliday junction resolvase RusA-like endonuclease